MLKSFFLNQKKLLNAILKASSTTWKSIPSNEMNCFLQCRRQHFMSLSLFAEKVILELKCTKSLLRASKNTNSVFSATKQLMRIWGLRCSKLLSQSEKVAKCNFKSKAQLHEKVFFLMKWTVFCNAEDSISWVWAFCRKSHFRA